MDEQDLEFLAVLRSEFYSEATETLNACEDILNKIPLEPENKQLLLDYKVTLHTLKGSSHAVEYFKMASVITLIEETVLELSNEIDRLVSVNLSLLSLAHKIIEFLRNGEEEKANLILEKILATKRPELKKS